QLTEGLSAVAALLGPQEAAQAAAQAAAALAQALKDSKDPHTLSGVAPDPHALSKLAQGLLAVAAPPEPKDATTVTAPAVTILIQAMSDAKDPRELQGWAQGLSALLSAVPPSEHSSRTATAASAVAFPLGAGHPFTALTPLIPAAERPS